MHAWAVQTFNSVAFAGLLFLLASGFTLIFGLMKIPNMAHGACFMLGAYIGSAINQGCTVRRSPPWASRRLLGDHQASLAADQAVHSGRTVGSPSSPTRVPVTAATLGPGPHMGPGPQIHPARLSRIALLVCAVVAAVAVAARRPTRPAQCQAKVNSQDRAGDEIQVWRLVRVPRLRWSAWARPDADHLDLPGPISALPLAFARDPRRYRQPGGRSSTAVIGLSTFGGPGSPPSPT
jgi:hypothetical protein